MTLRLLTESHLEFLSLTGGCTGSSESTHVKMLYCCHMSWLSFFLQKASENIVCCTYSQWVPAALNQLPTNENRRCDVKFAIEYTVTVL